MLQSSDAGIMRSDQVRYSSNGILYSNKQELQLHATPWMNLTDVLLSSRCQTQKSTTVCIHLYKGQKQEKLISSISKQESGFLGVMDRQ